MKLELLDFDTSSAACVWLVGDDINAYIIWLFADTFVHSNNIESIENYEIFASADDIKAVFNKSMVSFLNQSQRKFWNGRLLLRAIGADFEQCVHQDDTVVRFDQKYDYNKLQQWFLQKYQEKLFGANFDEKTRQFVGKNVLNLNDLVVCGVLASADIAIDDWPDFLQENVISWSQKFRQKTLLTDALLNDTIMPAAQYMLRADENMARKALLHFLLANIKDGAKLWEMNGLWKNLIDRVYA